MADRVRVGPPPAQRALVLRLQPRHDAATAAEGALGAPLPAAGTSTAAGGVRVLWQGPDEWLVFAPEDREPALRAALTGTAAAVVDVSAARRIAHVRGPGARDLLAQLCALDLHPREFPAGSVAQTVLAQLRVTLLCVDDTEPGFWVVYAPSVEDYLLDRLADARLGTY